MPIATYRLRCLSGSLSAPLLTTNNRLRCRSGSLSAPLLGRLSSTTNNRPGASQGSLSALQSEYTPLYPVDPIRVLILGFHRFCHTSGALSGSPSVARSGHTPPTRVTRPESEPRAPHPPAPPSQRLSEGVLPDRPLGDHSKTPLRSSWEGVWGNTSFKKGSSTTTGAHHEQAECCVLLHGRPAV